MEELKLTKQYYSISEVAKLFDVAPSLIRFWEQEIPSLRPKTMRGTNIRQYTPKDIENIKNVYNLVKIRGFKIQAAKKMFQTTRKKVDTNTELIDNLQSIRQYLVELRHQFAAFT